MQSNWHSFPIRSEDIGVSIAYLCLADYNEKPERDEHGSNYSAGGAGGRQSPCRGAGCPRQLSPFSACRRRRRERAT